MQYWKPVISRLFGRICLGIVAAGFALTAQAAPLTIGHVKIELVTESSSVQPGTAFTVGTHFLVDPHWHIYWINPGDAGAPTTIGWTLPQGFQAGPIQWPHPVRLPVPGALNFGYEDEVTFLNTLTPPADLKAGTNVPIKEHVTWLVCNLSNCIPGKIDLTANPTVTTTAPTPDPQVAAIFKAARSDLPQAIADWKFSAEATSDGGYRLIAEPTRTGVTLPSGDKPFYFNIADSTVENSAPQPIKMEGDKVVATLTRATFASDLAKRLTGVWVSPLGWGAGGPTAAEIDVPVGPVVAAGGAAATQRAVAGADATSSASLLGLLGAVALGLLGGLILNLMPCVFPVLGLKVMGFVEQAGADHKKVVMHGLVFTAGVLISFWALAGLLAVLRAGGEQLGWGFQLQSPAFVFALAAVMLVFAINLSGVFEIGISATATGSDLQSKSGLIGTFFTGFLATVVATPCSAPFLAPALSATLTLPGIQSFIVFTAIGLGLSLPYLLLSLFPSAVRILPRPGRWMETFKQIMAFPLYATVAWLLWVLAGQLSPDGLLNATWALVALAMGLWAYGRWAGPGAKRSSVRLAVASLVIMVGLGFWLGWPRGDNLASSTTQVAWEAWSPETVQRMRAENRTIYVDFTARWCATCQANKKIVFSSQDVLKTFADKRVAMLEADWTNQDPRITNELAKYHRNAIPFVIVYKPGQEEPTILPQLLTPDIVLNAVN